MKLLFVFTGGTIGSTQVGNVISADNGKPYRLIKAYEEKYGIDFDYDSVEPYTELSENNTGWHMRQLIECIEQNKNKGYDGIIVTHGTDTLQYTAAAVGYCFGAESLPICLIAANAPIENASSNALDNMRGAISFIKCKGGKGTFVSYRNSSSSVVQIHRATRLLASKAYTDELSSALEIPYGCFDGEFNFIKNENYREREDEIDVLDALLLKEQSEEIAIINAYAGMAYPRLSNEVKYVIFNTYHSGTLNTKSQGAIEFFNEARERGVKVYASGIYDGPHYSSAEEFCSLGIEPIKNIAPIAAYVKLWLISSMGKNPDRLLNKSLCGDML